MKKQHTLFYHIFIFVLAQIAWLCLLGIWIYWYVSNYIIFEKVGDQLSPQFLYDNIHVIPFVGGIVLLVSVSFGMSLIFRHLSIQLNLTNLYDNFIANVTHELKSPLSSIQLYLETLYTRNVPVAKQKEFLEMMMKDATRLKNLINSILEILALEQKKIAHDYHIYIAEEIVEKLLHETGEQFRLPPGSIKVTGSAQCKCVVDPSALRIVFNNLTDNAIKYSADFPEIRVILKYLDKKFAIEFSDNGIGIPVKEQKKIFNKFHRIYDRNIPNVKGTGLGLFWVREIIKNHGGKISAYSEGYNKGSTFRIELPVYQASKRRYINYLLKLTKRREKQLGRE